MGSEMCIRDRNGPWFYPMEPIAEVITDGVVLVPDALTLEIEGGLLFSQEMINGLIWFILKTVGVILVILIPRGVFPRIRIDLLLQIGWYKLIVLAFVNIFIALALVYGGIIGPEGIL